jgi:NAD(P)H-hydrate epimerase
MTLPAWLTPLPDPAQQRALDAWAIEQRHIAGAELMERAGAGLAAAVAARVPHGLIAIVCGKGNNGGDGYVAARLLRERGREVRVLALAAVDELRGDAAAAAGRLSGPPAEPFSAAGLAGAAGIVDAILGTGFSGEARGPAREAIDAFNAADAATVIACDIPSGVDGASGEAAGPAVRAELTITFHAMKPGLWIAPGKRHAGEVRVIDIGIPDGGPGDPSLGLIDPSVIDALPRRGSESTKFAAGSVLVVGGSTGLTGAPTLAARAAMRAGSGYVTAAIPASLNPIFEVKLTEAMTVPLADADGAIAPRALEVALGRAERVQAVALGPGIGRAEDTQSFVREFARRLPVPVVIDADGLFAHNGSLATLREREAPTVLTPHAGELSRLLGRPGEEIAARRLHHVRQAAADAGAVVVLKGDDTLVADPTGRVAVSRGGASALATAGTGDVLSGVLAAYLGKGLDPWTAACVAVLVHAAAGRRCAATIGSEGVVAGDVIEALPAALTDLAG